MLSSTSVRILLSRAAGERFGARIHELMHGRAHDLVHVEDAQSEDPVHIGFLTRDVTGLSTKFELAPATQRFFDTLDRSPGLAWVHTHSAGADRPMYPRLMARGVAITTSSGANAAPV